MTDKTESIRHTKLTIEMPLADSAVLLTPYGKGCVFVGAEL